ncbi:MAG: prolyl oligopeptidase family serine peptidase [Dehalococcoidia bacterium]|nr:prolyl oligopeptidase family serine peptidase [Dehalococcoidia bacterium]
MRLLALLSAAALLVACSGGQPPTGEHDDAPEAGSLSGSLAAGLIDSGIPEPARLGCYDRGPGDYIDAVERPEGMRSFRIHVPPGYDGQSLVPAVFNFHGQARTAEEQDAYSGFPVISDREGFILVSPEGGSYPQQWDIAGVYAEDGIDDVGAVSQMVDYVESQFCIDPGRVFAAGLSNGGQMAAQAGCYLSNQFAGVAPVAGIVFQGCEGPPVAVITFHGTGDYNVPYESAPEAVTEWARHNGCPETPEVEWVTSEVRREAYFGCEGAPVVFYTIEGGGHTWPGAEDNTGGIGPTTHDINASELIWDLFSRIRR